MDQRVITVIVAYTEVCAKFLRLVSTNVKKIRGGGRKIQITIIPDIKSQAAINKLTGMGVSELPAIIMQGAAPILGINKCMNFLIKSSVEDTETMTNHDDDSLAEQYNNQTLAMLRSGVVAHKNKNGMKLEIRDDEDERDPDKLDIGEIQRRANAMRKPHHGEFSSQISNHRGDNCDDREDDEWLVPAKQVQPRYQEQRVPVSDQDVDEELREQMLSVFNGSG